MKAKILYQKAITQWGYKFQLEMAMEECLELALAIRRCSRVNSLPIEKVQKIEEEIADVEIMMGQLRLIFNTKCISRIKARKLRRLQRRIENANNHNK